MKNMRALLVAAVLGVLGCGGHPPIPPHGVIEGDLGSWKFRRFQPLLDVEVWVEGNKAEAHSASYAAADAENRGHLDDKDVVNVLVTRYETADGVVRATVKFARRLAQDAGYQVEEGKIAGARTLSIIGRGEAWVMWPSNRHVVKIGGRGHREVPKVLVEQYVDRYPSQLPGGSLEGPLPPGRDDTPASSRKPEKPAYDPSNPRPDAEHYDPNKVKLPDSKKDATDGKDTAKDAKDADGKDAKDAKDTTDTEDETPPPPKPKPKKPRKKGSGGK